MSNLENIHRVLLLSVSFSLITFFLKAQNSEILQSQIDSLKKVKENLDIQSRQIGQEISKLTNRKLAQEREEIVAKGIPVYCRLETKVYGGRGTWTDLIGTIPRGTTIMAYDFKNNYYFVAFDTLNGYVMSMNVETLEVRNDRLEKQRKENLKREVEANTHRKMLVSKYGSVNGERVFAGKIWLGMTKEMAEDSWGKPSDINRTVGSWGVKEQWIYSDAYLYFDNGILNSWQD